MSALLFFEDDAPKEDAEWTHCFQRLCENTSDYSITMNFNSDQSNLRDTLKFSSNLQDLDKIKAYPIKNQSIEHALRTLRELEIHTEEYDNNDLEQFGLGTSSRLEIAVSDTNGESSVLHIGKDTQVGYSTTSIAMARFVVLGIPYLMGSLQTSNLTRIFLCFATPYRK